MPIDPSNTRKSNQKKPVVPVPPKATLNAKASVTKTPASVYTGIPQATKPAISGRAGVGAIPTTAAARLGQMITAAISPPGVSGRAGVGAIQPFPTIAPAKSPIVGVDYNKVYKDRERPNVSGGRGYFIPWTYQGVQGSLDTLTGDFLVNGVVYDPQTEPTGSGWGGGGGGYGGSAWSDTGRSGSFSNGLLNWRIGL